ncbi:importin subunit alpha-1a-like [Lycium ferocissimum]|uniref:importin subunit alpha-1a-like n=1 Tax=Lycium ferocissimum TaxID=112874 RepID=UPI0028158171|nr:importin subunit alpha-1a-like [Lycium ferocissimum]
MKELFIPPGAVKDRENWEKFQKQQRCWIMYRNRTDPYYNPDHYETELISKYGERRLFEQLPQMVRDFWVGFAFIESIGPFLLMSAAYRIMLLLRHNGDYHYDLPIDMFFGNGIIDVIECCGSNHWRSLRRQAAETLRQFILDGTNAQNQELLRRGVIPTFMQMLNDEWAINLSDEDWLNDFLIIEAVENLALLSTKVDIGGECVREFGERNLCGRLMLLFRNPRHTIVKNGLTFVENFLTRGSEDQIQVLLDNEVLQHLRFVIAEPAGGNLDLLSRQHRAALALGNFARRSIRWRDLVIDSGADLIPLFRVLRSIAGDANEFDPSPAMSAARTIGYLCFGSPSPSFAKLRPSLPVLRYLIDLEHHIGEEARAAIRHACLIIACLARGGSGPINVLVDEHLCPRLAMLLTHHDSEVFASVLKVVENFFKNGTENQIQRMVDESIFPPLIQISINQEVDDTKYEATYAISSAARRGSHDQIRYLVDQGSIPALSLGLLCEGYTRRTSCFQGLLKILRVGDFNKVDGVNIYIQMVTESGGLARIKSQMDDPDVGEIARRMLRSYWPREL